MPDVPDLLQTLEDALVAAREARQSQKAARASRTIIGLAGYSQSGKDTVANHLVGEYGFVKLSFADGVRAMMHELNPPLTTTSGQRTATHQWYVDTHGYEWTKANTNARDWLVKIGAGARRVFHDYVWIDRLERALDDMPYDQDVVISDVRYPNEASMIQAEGGEVWRIDRHVPFNDEEARTVPLITPDHVISNTGTVDDLLRTAERLL